MNRTALTRPLHLTSSTRTVWAEYEAANRRAAIEYVACPTALPRLREQLSHCLCCDVFSAEFAVCLACRRIDSEWAAVADDPERAAFMRRAVLFGRDARMPDTS